MSTISELDKNKCTGCRCCEKVCPVNAIQMIENKEGFIEPSIREEKCINCGLCYKRCPQIYDLKSNKLENVKVFAAKNKDIENQKNSSSGGIFSILATYILEQKGIVYGCAFNSELIAEHIRISNISELYKLKGSKYVQSNTKNTFFLCKQDLENNKKVLYSGTPCQIAGLKNYLVKEYENLITIDLICHGVPSPKLFKKYKEWLEEKNKSKIKNFEFRNKEKNGWGLNAKIIFFNGKVKYTNSRLDPYYKTFLEASDYREVCYSCKYANINRISDITLADYWGIEIEHPEFADENGVSAILINTDKGDMLIKNVQERMSMISTTLDKVMNRNLNLKEASVRVEKRNKIYEELNELDFESFIKKKIDFKVKKKDLIKWIIPYKVKKKIRKIIKGF